MFGPLLVDGIGLFYILLTTVDIGSFAQLISQPRRQEKPIDKKADNFVM